MHVHMPGAGLPAGVFSPSSSLSDQMHVDSCLVLISCRLALRYSTWSGSGFGVGLGPSIACGYSLYRIRLQTALDLLLVEVELDRLDEHVVAQVAVLVDSAAPARLQDLVLDVSRVVR